MHRGKLQVILPTISFKSYLRAGCINVVEIYDDDDHTFKSYLRAGCIGETPSRPRTNTSFKSYLRAGCIHRRDSKSCTPWNLQVVSARGMHRQKHTVLRLMHGLLCAYLNLFECIAGFVGKDLRPLSRFRDGKSPQKSAGNAVFLCLLHVRTGCRLNQLVNSLDGKILRRVVIGVSLETAGNAAEQCLGLSVIRVYAAASAASL